MREFSFFFFFEFFLRLGFWPVRGRLVCRAETVKETTDGYDGHVFGHSGTYFFRPRVRVTSWMAKLFFQQSMIVDVLEEVACTWPALSRVSPIREHRDIILVCWWSYLGHK